MGLASYQSGGLETDGCEIKSAALLLHLLDLNSCRVIDPELEQGSVGINKKIGLERGRAKGLAFAVEFLDGKGVQRNRVAAEPKLVENGRVMKQDAGAAFVLADEGIGDVEHHAVAHRRKGIDFWNSDCETVRVILKAQGVVHAAESEAVEVSTNPGCGLIQQRSDADDFGDLLTENFRDEGFAPDVIASFPKFQIPIDKVADDGAVWQIKISGVITGFHGAFGTNVEQPGEFYITRVAQVVAVPVPDNDVFGR